MSTPTPSSGPTGASDLSEPGASASDERGLQASAVRRSLLRALLSGVAGSMVCAGIGCAMGFDWRSVGNVAFQGFLGGAVLGAVALFESVAWPRGTPTRRRLLATCAAVWVLASLLCLAALVESLYARGFLESFDSDAARERTARVLHQIHSEPRLFAGVFAALGLPFALGALARGCALRVPEQIVVSALGAIPPGAALLLGTRLAPPTDSRFCFAIVVAATVLLPLAAWLGDLVEQRSWGSAAPRRERQRLLAWSTALSLLMLGAPAAYGFGATAVRAREEKRVALQTLTTQVRELVAFGHYARAVALCVEAQANDALDSDAWQLGWSWAEASWYTGEPPPPSWLYDAADSYRIFNGDAFMREGRVRIRLEQGDFQGALADCEYLEAVGFPPELLGPRASAHLALGQVEAAEADLRAAERVELSEDLEAEVAEVRARLEAARRAE